MGVCFVAGSCWTERRGFCWAPGLRTVLVERHLWRRACTQYYLCDAGRADFAYGVCARGRRHRACAQHCLRGACRSAAADEMKLAHNRWRGFHTQCYRSGAGCAELVPRALFAPRAAPTEVAAREMEAHAVESTTRSLSPAARLALKCFLPQPAFRALSPTLRVGT